MLPQLSRRIYDPGVAERTLSKTFIKQWRTKRGLSLRRLAARMEVEPGGDEVISHVSIGRIENGKQPYSQPILEALAQALGVTTGMLLESDPTKEGQVIDLVRRLDDAKRKQAIDYLKYLASG